MPNDPPHWQDPALQDAITAALEAERRRLAAHLEDTLISQTKLLVDQLRAYEQSATAQTRLPFSVLSSLARGLLQAALDLQASLHPSVLETLGLPPALEALAQQIRRRTGADILLDLATLPARLPTAIELLIFRATQEALEQATGPGKASRLRISLERTDDGVLYCLASNGTGFSSERWRALQQRAAVLGGRLSLGESRAAGREIRLAFSFAAPVELTEREMAVIQRVAEGQTNREIAFELDVRPRTVKFHLDNIFSKLGVSTRTEAAIYALRQGWVKEGPPAGPPG